MKADSIFIHSMLDDYGLTPNQFRVFAHIARRAGRHGCYGSIAGIAAVCKLNQKTTRKCVQFLLSQQLISATTRPGQTSIFTVNTMDKWKPNPSQTRPGVDSLTPPNVGHTTPANIGQGHPSQTRPGHPSQSRLDEGSPSEGSPTKEIHLRGNRPQKLFPNECEKAIKDCNIAIESLTKQIENAESEKKKADLEIELQKVKNKKAEYKEQRYGSGKIDDPIDTKLEMKRIDELIEKHPANPQSIYRSRATPEQIADYNALHEKLNELSGWSIPKRRNKGPNI